MQSRLVFALWALISSVACAEEPLAGFPPDAEPVVPELAADGPADPLFVRVYPVADLVVQPAREESAPAAFMAVESSPNLAAAPARHTPPGQSALEHMAELSVILQSAVLPESWDMSGGPAHVAVHGASLSLVVRQTSAGHEEISQVLDELRRNNEKEIELSWQVYSDQPSSNHTVVDPDLVPAFDDLATAYAAPLAGSESERLTRTLSEHFAALPRRRVRLQNGWFARLSDEVGCQAVAAADGRSIRIHLDVATPAASRRSIFCRVPAGQTAVVMLPTADGAPGALALVSARIASDVPAEEHLAPPESKPLAPAPTAEPEAGAADVAEEPTIQPTVFEASEERGDVLTTIVFPVADLMPVNELPTGDASAWETELQRLATELARNVGIGGNERIAVHPQTLSLVVRQSQEHHDRLAQLLVALRQARAGAMHALHQTGASAVRHSLPSSSAP